MDADDIMHEPSRILEAENSKLEYLKTLSTVVISYSESTSDALEKFPNLQHFDCMIKEPIDPPTHGDWFPKFDVLNKLESLITRYYKKTRSRFDSELIPPPIENHFPSSLKQLWLYDFPLRPALLSAIAALPELEILALLGSAFANMKWDASEDIYQSLKTLHLRGLSEWQVDTETFPKLEKLILEDCEELTEIPCAFGDIDTLKSIHLTSINNSNLGDSANAIKKDVQDFTGEDRLSIHEYDSSECYRKHVNLLFAVKRWSYSR